MTPTEQAQIQRMAEPMYRAEATTDKCVASLRINDVRLFSAGGRARTQSVLMLNPWLIKGRNDVSAELSPRTDQENLSAAAFVCTVTVQDMAVPKASRTIIPLAEIKFDPKQDKKQYPQALPGSFDVLTPFPAWSWTTAAPLRADAATQKEALALMQGVWDALNKKNMDSFLQLQATRVRELSTSLFTKPDEVASDIRGDIESLLASGAFQLKPLPAEGLTFSLMADSRIVQPMRAEGVHPICMTEPGGMVSEVPLFLARIDRGRLAWVR